MCTSRPPDCELRIPSIEFNLPHPSGVIVTHVASSCATEPNEKPCRAVAETKGLAPHEFMGKQPFRTAPDNSSEYVMQHKVIS